MLIDVTKRRFITRAWQLSAAVAAGAHLHHWAIRKLGGKNWNRLHKLIYLAAICGVIHYWWQVKTGVLKPLDMTVVFAVLLLIRPVIALAQRRKPRSANAWWFDRLRRVTGQSV